MTTGRRFRWLLPFLATAAVACGNRDEARVDISLQGAPDSTRIVVSRLALNELQALDTLYTVHGKAVCKVEVYPDSPEFIYLTFGEGGNVSLLLQKGDRVSVSAGWDDASKAEISGSEESLLMQEVDADSRNFSFRFDSLYSALSQVPESGAEAARLKRELGSLYVKYKQEAIKYIMAHPASMSVIPLLYQKTSTGLPVFAEATDAIIMERVYDTLRTVYPASPYLVSLADEVSLRRNAMEMQYRIEAAQEVDFPEIALNDIEGKQRSLTALKGKVIILMFWDASNTEQRVYNTDLKSLYAKYHSRGLEIYQVGLNSDKTAWAMQVKEQELPWISVCDPAAGASSGAMLYNVTEVPAMFLISRDGTIVAKNLFDTGLLDGEVRRLL